MRCYAAEITGGDHPNPTQGVIKWLPKDFDGRMQPELSALQPGSPSCSE